jgi:hypothetical protein
MKSADEQSNCMVGDNLSRTSLFTATQRINMSDKKDSDGNPS